MVKIDDSFAESKVDELHAIEEERLVSTMSSQLGYPYVDLRDTAIDPEAITAIPEKQARSVGVVGFKLNQFNLSIASRNPNSPEVQEVINSLQSRRYTVIPHICSDQSLKHAWERYSDVVDTTASQKGVLSVDVEETVRLAASIKEMSDVPKLIKEREKTSNTHRVSETLSVVFAGALALVASDIHIEPEETGVRLRYRLDGVLHDIADIDKYIYTRLMSRLKLLSGMTLNVKAEAQDGRFTFDTGEREVEVRSSIIPGALGESIVMRILDPTVASFDLETINLNPYVKVVLEQQLKRPNGLIITTGPTGSGKTTALYAFLREVHDSTKKIITIENPVEYKLEGVVHTQTDKDYTFAKGLRAILRQDPDVIMVGEIRDKEVAETAIHAAQTGHLVFSTLHTNNAVAGFGRLIDLGVNPQVLGTAINLILGQRLVRTLCNECKVAYKPEKVDLDMIKNIMAEHPYPTIINDSVTLYRASGCAVCGNTGFKGRMGIFEGVVMDEAVEEVVLRDPREHSILEAAKPQKIPTMLQDGIDKVLAGETSLVELERVIEFPHHLSTTHIDAAGSTNMETPETTDEDFSEHVV